MNSLRAPELREIEIEATLGRQVSAEAVREMADVLLTLLDEAQDAQEEHADIGELLGVIPRLEKLREEAVQEQADAEDAHEKKLEEQYSEHEKQLEEEREKRLDMEKTTDEWKRRAEKAEHDLMAGVKNGHVLDDAAARELAEMKSNLEIALTRRANAQGEATRLMAENERLKDAASRGAAYAREKAEGEIEQELSAVRKALAESQREAVASGRRAAELRVTLGAIAEGKPEDAHRVARIVVGRVIIEKTGTDVRETYIPTRAERKKARAAR